MSSCHGEERDNTPLFRRVLLPPERVAEEMKRVPDGVLLRMPLAEFDALADRAAQAGTRTVPPRLLEARYHATLKEGALIGEGQWKLIHKGPSPGLLNLEPFNLAMRQARFENGDALIAAFDGKAPALLVENVGEQTVSLDWSARGEEGPEGVQFHLEAPSCPVAVLELDVPAGRGVTVLNDGAILSGPHEAETNELRRWKIVCGGQRRLDFRILPADRSSAGTEQTPRPLVRQKTTQKLHPEGLDATFELTLEGLPRGVRELVCECDAELRLREVTGPSVEGCSFQAGAENKPARLTIRLREPVRGGTWQIVCLAPLRRTPASDAAQPIAWRSPGLHLVNGVPRGETLALWLHPEVRVDSWDPGRFRLRSSDVDRATGMQVLTLRGGGLGPSRRPQARLQVHGVEFRAPQLAWWRCDAAGMALTLQIAWDVRQGQLFQLPVRLPRDWSVEKVEMNPAALLRDWRVRPVEGKATLFVDLRSPLGVRSTSESALAGEASPRPATSARTRLPLLTVQLRPAWSGPLMGKPLPFPEAVPLGARFREGALALDCDEQLFHLNVRTRVERSEADSEGPWGSQLPEYYYRYSDRPLQGELQVQPRPPRLRAKCNSEVFVVSGLAVVETRLQLEAEVGNLDTIELLMSANDGKPWQWREESPRRDDAAVNRVRRAERVRDGETSAAVQALAARNPLQAALLLAAQPKGERWRLTLARPLRAREVLRLRARRQLQPRANHWDVPLPVVLRADRMEGEVRLYLAGSDLMEASSFGLREVASVAEKGTTPWRTFRYGQNEVGLLLSGRTPAAERSTAAVIERARLYTAVGANGVLRHHFSFQVANWTKHALPLLLPPGSRPLAVAVDGRWLPRLLPSTSGDDNRASNGEAIELTLPVPGRAGGAGGDSVHGFEILYTRSLSASLPWQALEAPAPRLPIAPLAFRRVWHLPAILTPLHEGRYQALSIPSAPVELPALPHHLADLFHLPGSWARLDPLLEDRQAGAREALDRAIQELRVPRGERTMPLREVVSDLAFLYLKDRYSLIIDAVALREAGVTPDTLLTIKGPAPDEAPPWEMCGLIAVPARSTILLTTLAGRGSVLREPLGDALEQSLVVAASRGQDVSGRFRSVLNWLHPASVSDAAPAASQPLEVEDHGTDGSEWEPVAGASEETLIVVRRDAVTASGLTLTLFLGLLFWLLRRRSVRLRVTLLLQALGLFGVGVLWLPSTLRELAWWPLLAGCGGAALWYVRGSLRSARTTRAANRKGKRPAAAALAGLAALTLLGWNSRAAAPTPATVYIVPGPADAPRKQTVLVPADLLDRLKKLASPAPLTPGGRSAVLLDASYEGQMREGQAEFSALFSVHCLRDESTALTLGLAGVQLAGDVLLDGARTAPLALPAPQAGYSLSVRGRGRHKIELRFRVPVVGTPEDRNVLFSVPPLVRSRLSWRVPPGAVQTRNLVKFGAQWTLRDAGGERVEADLGALPRPVHLHWNQPARPTRVFYRAAYLWDLGLEANHLTTWLRYRIPQGAVQTLQVVLPADLEVGSASAQRILLASPPAWLTRFQLRDWHVRDEAGKRTLHLTLPYPISGEFLVTLELLPRRPLASPAKLSLPWPHEAAADGPHFLAYRTHPGLNAVPENWRFVSRIGVSEFALDWPSVPRLEANFPGAAYRINVERSPEQAQLRLHLDHRPPLFEAEVDVAVQVAAQRTQIQLVADLTAPNKDLAAVVWDLRSPCTIVAVSGAEVRSWKQSDKHLLVWLNRTTATTRIHLTGWLPLDRSRVPPHLHLLGPRLQQASKQHTQIHLVTVGDVALAAVKTTNLKPTPSAPLRLPQVGPASRAGPGSAARLAAPTTESERAFETWESFYDLQCEVQTAANAKVRVLTLAEVADRELRFTTTVHYQIQHGELRHVQLRLRNWEPEKVDVQAERVALWSGPRRSAGERSWHLRLQAGVTGHYQATLHYSMPLDDAAAGLPMPQVLVTGVENPEYLLAVAGGELTGQARGSLGLVKNPAKTLKHSWPGVAARLERSGGQVWRVGSSEWQLRLLPHARALEPVPVRVYLLEQSAAVLDGRRWLHEARYWLHHEAHTELHIEFPAPVSVLAAVIDSVPATPLQPAASRLWLTLPGRPGVRCIRLRWLYDSPEPLDRPNLASPQVVDAVKGPRLWTVRVPAGWEAAESTPNARLGSGATRTAALALYRAEAQLRMSQDLSKQRQDNVVSAALTLAQQRFALSCRQARQALDLGANRGGVVGPEGQSLAEWLEKLQAENHERTKQNGLSAVGEAVDAAGAVADDPASRFTDPDGGTPLSWQARADGQPPRLQLTLQASQQTRQALAASGQWLGGLVVVWILSFLPFLRARLRPFWPEHFALMGLLGWHLVGLTTIVLGLLLFALCGRSWLLVRIARSLFRRRPNPGSTMTAGGDVLA